MLGIVVSRADSASVHIGEQLRSLTEWEQSVPTSDGGEAVYRTEGATLREFEQRHLDMEGVAAAFDDPELIIFASKHAGETGELLTAHVTGNFGPADHGGRDNELARAPPNAHDRVLDALETHAPERYEVGMECTHHGPSQVGAPSLFVEVGSDEPQWSDPEAARAVARAILDLRRVSPDRAPEADGTRRHLVGFGGGHYAPRFERIVRETGWAVGHVAADWGLDAMGAFDTPESEQLVADAFEQSHATHALVEGDRPELVATVEALGYRVVSETWIRETDGVDLGFVRRAESAVASVDEGLRFGANAPAPGEDERDGPIAVTEFPDKLVDAARGIDREATTAALRETTRAFLTDQGGTRVTGTAVLGTADDRETVVDRLLDILAKRYDSVERAGGRAVAREQVFDPERAATLGVPEGPKFGRLASGTPVDVDGETIPPDVVHETRTQEFPLDEDETSEAE
jgi:D-aminoacyl-tRNA deacylase